MEPTDLTIEVSRQIRDGITLVRDDLRTEIAGLRTEVRGGLAGVRQDLTEVREELAGVRTHVEHVDVALLDLAQQQRSVVRHLRALTSRDRRTEIEMEEIRARLDDVETRLPPR